jgi:hypothetical protein
MGKPALFGLVKIVKGSFEHWRSEGRFHVERRLTGIAEPMPVTHRHNHGLPGCQGGAFITDPDLSLTSKHGEHFLHGMQVGECATARVAPLLKDAQLRCAGQGRAAHAREHARPLQLPLLFYMIDDAHQVLAKSAVGGSSTLG